MTIEAIRLVNGPIYRVGMGLGWWFHIRANSDREAQELLDELCEHNGVKRREATLHATSGYHYEGADPVVVIMEGRR